MQLNPRYGPDPVITLDGPPSGIIEPAVRQRRRLAAALESMSDEQWAHPSRCEGWSTRDVIVHLDSTNAFWNYSITAGVRDDPTEVLAAFDPVATPAAIVAGSGDVAAGDVLDGFMRSTKALEDLLGTLDDGALTATAEAPPGHLSVSAVAHHVLWDSWVHERDILIPLGIDVDEEADEVAACLRYVAALAPALAVNNGTAVAGTLVIDVTDPDLGVVVEIGDRIDVRAGTGRADLRLTGGAVELVEALSLRRSLNQEVPSNMAWMIHGLADAFDSELD